MEQLNTIRQEDILYSIFLDRIPGVGRKTIHKLLRAVGQPEEIYSASKKQRQEWIESGLLSRKQEEAWSAAKERTDLEKVYEKMTNQGIRCVPYNTARYPERLTEIADPPLNLYVRGGLPSECKPTVAVVGARLCSDYGSYMAKQIGKTLTRSGIQVISGMAMGVDGLAQQAAIDVGGKSYGVLGCGVDICYPPQNRALYEKLLENGGVVSEYCPGTEPRPGFFPERNRIISGLADAVMVVEAREKSGTLITVDAALEQGREVYAVPGRVTDILAAGCNRLIMQGAGVVLSAQTVVDAVWETWETKYGSDAGKNKRETEQGEEDEIYMEATKALPQRQKLLVSVLSEQGKSVDELCMLLRECTPPFTTAEVTAELMKLCVEKYAYMKNGRFYRRERMTER